MSDPRKTVLYGEHEKAGGRFVDFGGWLMPVQYTGTLVEHHAVRTEAGLFDVSHMGEVLVRGPEAIEATNRIVTNDLSRLEDGRAMYTAMCTPEGGIVDDLIVYRVRADELFLCVNAGNREKDFNWIVDHLTGDAEATNESDDWGQIALQGPNAKAILASLLGTDEYVEMKPFRFVDVPWNDAFIRVATTGYTGSGGYELYLPEAHAPAFWVSLLEHGAPHGLIPAGLGARDTLRLEMGYCLYGSDIDETTSPLEAGLGWVTKLEKDDFVGKDALVQQKEDGITRKLVGFELTDRGIARAHATVWADGKQIGEVTSGNMSPVLKYGVGLAYVAISHATPGTAITVEVRGRHLEAVVAKLPFVGK
jgi:aminomethyltransferase